MKKLFMLMTLVHGLNFTTALATPTSPIKWQYLRLYDQKRGQKLTLNRDLDITNVLDSDGVNVISIKIPKGAQAEIVSLGTVLQSHARIHGSFGEELDWEYEYLGSFNFKLSADTGCKEGLKSLRATKDVTNTYESDFAPNISYSISGCIINFSVPISSGEEQWTRYQNIINEDDSYFEP